MQNIHEKVLPVDDMGQLARKVFTSNKIGITDPLQLLDMEFFNAAAKSRSGPPSLSATIVARTTPAYKGFTIARRSCANSTRWRLSWTDISPTPAQVCPYGMRVLRLRTAASSH